MFFYLYVLKIYVGPYQTLRQRQRNQQALDNVDYTTQNIEEEDSGPTFGWPLRASKHRGVEQPAVNWGGEKNRRTYGYHSLARWLL